MRFKKIFRIKPDSSALLMLIAMMFAFSLMSPFFLTFGNFQIVLQPIPEIALVAIGVTILMISGEFDLSVGSVFALSPMVMVLLMSSGVPLPISMIGGLAVAALVGFVNAAITIRLGIPSFIATLGMLFMARSLTIVISGGFPPPFPRDLDLWWIVGKVDLLRVSIFWLLGIGIILGVWLRKFDFGSWIFATGGNQEAARDMGINVKLVKTTTFMLCSVLAGLAGMIQVFRIKAIVPSMGTGYELTAIAAAVIGGAALSGGIGSVVGAVIGALLIAFIENIIILTRVDANWFRFAVGAMIVIAVTINKMARDASNRSKFKDNEDE
ncbi:MAG: ABC transporter permease [Rhizobiales bacterium]|nr:ABC transporter permease [Hyphomicrobiales bacterium]